MKKETKKAIGRYVFSSVMLLVFSLLFSLFSLIFIIDKIPHWLQFILSFVFMAPIMFLAFTQGRTQGERLFRDYAKTTLSDIHSEEALQIPAHRCVFHILGFCVPLVVLTVLSVILQSVAVRLAVLAFTFPVALLFSSIGVLDLAKVTPLDLAIFLPYVLAVSGMFVLGYLLKIAALKRQHASIRSELRSFDN